MTSVNIAGLDRAAVLAALYNASKPQGLGFLDPRSIAPMTAQRAAEVLAEAGQDPYFDYLQGRVMKIRLSDELDPRLYDRDNGDGACAAAIDGLRNAAS
ncbi:hypothetical protein [Streptomyces beihaiensis]|uniref:Uncharacterized protein n=1 Tax=Streptomyces beihaiensis TaxID=2984495 RepID=A0ABT3TRD9_9ACTN|nr:hypothetical protein [Streptomyces beihaiensis]MCX3059604.1 hypothetical protein [Streptomyces beihaiensis]